MPELPEVESVRRSLEPRLTGARVSRVRLQRADIVTGPASPIDLLGGARITGVLRRGKQLALEADTGRVLVVHLGMSGQFVWLDPGVAPERTDHIHARWSLRREPSGRDAPDAELIFRDPRRFGGLWTLPTRAALDVHWASLGPDALTVTPGQLRDAITTSARTIKAVLLDQSRLAGVGNIYADEALFGAGLDPHRRADRLTEEQVGRLAGCLRAVLTASVAAGGSTLRDYRSGVGLPGGFQASHAVYGRGGQPCVRCRTTLAQGSVAQRTTVWCPRCQQARRGG